MGALHSIFQPENDVQILKKAGLAFMDSGLFHFARMACKIAAWFVDLGCSSQLGLARSERSVRRCLVLHVIENQRLCERFCVSLKNGLA